MLRAGLRGKRLKLSDDDRRRLAVKAQALGRAALAQIASVATPATLLRWYRCPSCPKIQTNSKTHAPGRRRFGLPLCGSTGARATTPSNPSTIITTMASPELADIHHRQPAIITPDRFDDWLDPTSPVPRLLDLVREPYGGPYEKRTVSTRVNSVRNDDPDTLAPRSEMGLF